MSKKINSRNRRLKFCLSNFSLDTWNWKFAESCACSISDRWYSKYDGPLFSDTPPSPHSVIVRFTVNKSCTRWCHIPTAFAPLALRGYLVLIAGVMSLCSQLGCTENNVTSGHRSGILPHEISYFIYIIYIHINGYVIFLSVIVIIIAKLASSLSLSLGISPFSPSLFWLLFELILIGLCAVETGNCWLFVMFVYHFCRLLCLRYCAAWLWTPVEQVPAV